VYAKDGKGTHYDIEMQAIQKVAIDKRSRYYHSQMDMELLRSGEGYSELPNAYVIFICDFDPFGKKKYCYTFESVCQEDKTLVLEDGRKSIFLSTKGENSQEVSESLIKFLHFVSADLTESEKDFQDEFVERLQESVKQVKDSREMEERFMVFQEMLKEEREEGRAEGRAEGRVEGRMEGCAEGREKELLRQVKRKIKKNKTIEQISEELELEEDEVKELVQLLRTK